MKKIFEKLINLLNRFMYGRYGLDKLSEFIYFIGLVFVLLSFGGRFRLTLISGIIFGMFAVYRCLSFDWQARREELAIYMKMRNKLSVLMKYIRLKFTDRKHYRYCLCKSCDKILRVPVDKGKVMATCPVCGRKYRIKS